MVERGGRVSGPLFVAENVQASEADKGPAVRAGEHDYAGYFENAYGEQWIFTFDRESGKGTLTGGDVDWESLTFSDPREVGIHWALNRPEQMWLLACWSACVPDWDRPQRAGDGSTRA